MKSHHQVSVCVLCSCFIKEEVYIQEIVTSKFLFGEGLTCPWMLSWTRTHQAMWALCATCLVDMLGQCRENSDAEGHSFVALCFELWNLGICKMSSLFSFYTGDHSIPFHCFSIYWVLRTCQDPCLLQRGRAGMGAGFCVLEVTGCEADRGEPHDVLCEGSTYVDMAVTNTSEGLQWKENSPSRKIAFKKMYNCRQFHVHPVPAD